jgi:hypothetical protein
LASDLSTSPPVVLLSSKFHSPSEIEEGKLLQAFAVIHVSSNTCGSLGWY